MSANSVLAPQDGMTRPDNSEYLAGIGRKELSECHSRSPSLKNHTRSWSDMILPDLSRLEKSAMPAPSREFLAFADVASGVVALELAKMPGKVDLLLIAERLIAEHEHRVLVHAGLDRRCFGRRQRFAAIDAGDLCAELRANRIELISPSHALPMVNSRQAQPECMVTCNQVGPKDAKAVMPEPGRMSLLHRLLKVGGDSGAGSTG